jgi:protocatechuate 3,4-dioxygenase beta subunit
MKTFTAAFILSLVLYGLVSQINAQPKPPQNLTASQQNLGNYLFVKLDWQAQSTGTAREPVRYNIYRKTVKGIDTAGAFKKLYEYVMLTTWVDRLVEKGNTYSYYITAVEKSKESGPSNTVTITLDSGIVKAVITGTLKDNSTGKPIAHGHVAFIPSFSWNLENPSTDSLGNFSTTLFAGTYIIYASADGYIPAYYNNAKNINEATKIVVKGGDSLNYNITLNPKITPKKFTLKGNVSDSLGKPLKSIVEVYDVALNSFTHSYYQTATDSSGNYSLPVRQGDTVIAYAHSFSNDYVAQFYNDKSTILTADRIPISQDVSNINFVLQHKPVYKNGISGTVTNKDSVGIHSIILAIRRGDYKEKSSYSIHTDSTGNYSFTGLIPGQYILLAMPQGGYLPTFFRYDGTQTLKYNDADSVVVGASGIKIGINFIVAARPDSGDNTVSGFVKDNSNNPVDGALVYASDENNEIYSFGITEPDGKYTISGLIPGDYSITSQSYGYNDAQAANVSLDNNSNFSASASFTVIPQAVTSVKEQTPVVNSFELNQNYPNPFNPSTIISFKVPYESKVTLKIYNVLGSEVATLLNENKKAGNYNVTFNASGLASGVYFYQLHTSDTSGKAGDFVVTKKLVLMK